MDDKNQENGPKLSEFIDSWETPSNLLWATSPLNLSDDFVFERMMKSQGNSTHPPRVTYSPGSKTTDAEEAKYRKLDFFRQKQSEWSSDFRERLENRIDLDTVKLFLDAIRTEWVDGYTRRQNSEIILRIKASVQNYDRATYGENSKKFVSEIIPSDVIPLFEINETAYLFEINAALLHTYLQDYLDHLDNHLVSTPSDLVVRRGIFLGSPPGDILVERYLMSSYTLSLSASEQFSITYSSETGNIGEATIIGCALSEIQKRVIAFAPFIPSMGLDQMELILPPPVKIAHLSKLNSWGGITEYALETQD